MNEVRKRPVHVLIVDDEPNMRSTLGDIFEDEGYVVDLAASGEEALQMCDVQQFDALLMDLRMPGMDGLETFHRIRARQREARVILMSAYGTENIPLKALSAGVVAFLRKPLDVDQVLRLIDGVRDANVLVIREPGSAPELDGLLRHFGYRTTVAPDALQAIGLVEQIRYELVFIDADTRSMDALHLYLAIRERAPSSVAIILAGNEAEADIARRAIERTAYAALEKPLREEQLAALIERLTGQIASGAMRKPSQE